jgi:hypothetical protein
MTSQPAAGAGTLYVTLSGLPLFIALKWPFHRASSGADFYVLHADLRLADGSGLHALASVNLSLTVVEVLPSLEQRDTESPVINALRKEIDRKQLEFMKSPKLVPVHFNSRYWSFKQNRWAFPAANDDEIMQFLLRKIFWASRLTHSGINIADATDAQYLSTTPEHQRELAEKLAAQNLIRLEGDLALASEGLTSHAPTFEADMKSVLEDLQQKHAFERG